MTDMEWVIFLLTAMAEALEEMVETAERETGAE